MSDEWVKMIVDEIRVTNKKIDDLREDVSDGLQEVHGNVAKVYSKTVEIETNVGNLQKLSDKHEVTLYGNGQPGLNSKVEMFETKLNSLQENREKDEVEKKVKELENNKYSSAVKIAIISGSISAIVALIVLAIEMIIK
jgi:hypothetical protein